MKHILIMQIAMISLIATACSTAKLSDKGNSVEVVSQLEQKNCRNLGPVFGKGGGSFGGGWISDEKLMEYASNDLRNKAADKGANYVVASAHQMGQTTGQYGGTTSTATVTGVAYSCRLSQASLK